MYMHKHLIVWLILFFFQLRDDNYTSFFMHQFNNHDFPNAIYTHQYDDTGTRMFVAGGPLPAGLTGNYAGLWTWDCLESRLVYI